MYYAKERCIVRLHPIVVVQDERGRGLTQRKNDNSTQHEKESTRRKKYYNTVSPKERVK